MNPRSTGRRRKILLGLLAALAVYLGAESFLPAGHQPGARAAQAAVGLYQATGSPLLRAAGVRCRYTPSCSHYAHEAFGHYGTLGGFARTMGRLLRCTPWGGAGYDPPVEIAVR